MILSDARFSPSIPKCFSRIGQVDGKKRFRRRSLEVGITETVCWVIILRFAGNWTESHCESPVT